MKLIRALILALACCVASPLVLADDASDAFDQGSAAFNRKDYDAAFPFFQKAAQMGHSKSQNKILKRRESGIENLPNKVMPWRKSA
jgi:TPR repeat protein